MWDNSPTNLVQENLEQQAIVRSLVQEVELAAMVKYNLRRLQGVIGNLAGQVGGVQARARGTLTPAAPFQRALC
jgi:hypothetical protein